MVVIGLVLLLIGLFVGPPILWIIGLVLILVGLFVNMGPGPYRRRVW